MKLWKQRLRGVMSTQKDLHMCEDSQETLRMEKGQTDAGPEKILELLSHNSSLIQEALHSSQT